MGTEGAGVGDLNSASSMKRKGTGAVREGYDAAPKLKATRSWKEDTPGVDSMNLVPKLSFHAGASHSGKPTNSQGLRGAWAGHVSTPLLGKNFGLGDASEALAKSGRMREKERMKQR